MKPTCVWCIFRFVFKFVFPRLFLNIGYLFCLICKTVKITMNEQRKKRERKTKQSYLIAKKNLVIGHLSMTSVNKSKISPFPPNYRHPLLVWTQPTLGRLRLAFYYTPPSPPSNFRIFLKNVNHEINMVTLAFFFAMHTIFTILVSIIKLTGKWTDFHLSNFCERLM